MSAPAFAIPGDLARAVRAARFVAVLTGAGVSAESGVPTFRDALTGLWARYDPRALVGRLFATAIDRGGEDDLSAVVLTRKKT